MKHRYTVVMHLTASAPAWVGEIDDEVTDLLGEELDGLIDGLEVTVADPDSDKEADLSFDVGTIAVTPDQS